MIYAWNGYSYVDVSTKYPGYYRKELASLRKEIEAADPPRVQSGNGAVANASGPGSTSAKPPPSPSPAVSTNAGIAREHPNVSVELEPPAEPASVDTGNLDCARAEADQDLRILGFSRDAGIADAIRWAESDNKSDRDFALSVL